MRTFAFMKKWNPHVFIHGFALLHAATVAVCAWFGIPDTLALTALMSITQSTKEEGHSVPHA